jgi:hypothetical protein
MKFEVEVKGNVFENYDEKDIEASVIDKAAQKIVDELDVKSKVEAMFNGLVEKRVEAIILEAVNEGIRKTNNWGEPTGEPTTLRTAIMEAAKKLTEPRDEGYGRSKKASVLTEMVEEAVLHAMKTDLVKQTQELKEQIKEKLNSAVLGDLKKKVDDALKGY